MIERNERARRRTAAAAFLALALLAWPAGAWAGPRAVADGIEFTFFAPGAGKVNLAGTFNGWNATQNPLADDGKGNWSIVVKLGPGKHSYKFVVDGGWVADPENPNSEPDPYGSANSVVTVGADGKLVETAAARPLSNTPLNARVFVSGRYLTRLETQKNVDGDPRYRLRRPTQQVDLNFHTTVSDVVEAYTRLRLDNEQNIILNNVSGYLDEASLDVHPGPVHVVGYRNMEILQLDDPLSLGGDDDLPGTILDDHLKRGKGTAGLTVEADPFGAHLQGFFADVYDADYYGDPDLFDDTGRDLIGLRLSRRFGGFEVGLPAVLQRGLNWMDFGAIVAQPAGSGIPSLDRWRADSGDPSTYYEFEDHDYRFGVDLTRRWREGRGVASLELLFGGRGQSLVTGNDAGLNSENGSVDVGILSRTTRAVHGSLDLDVGGAHHLNVEHTSDWESGAEPDERLLSLAFLPQSTANRQIYFVVGGSPGEIASHYTEGTWSWQGRGREHRVWLQLLSVTEDYAGTGGASPYDAAAVRPKLSAWSLAGRSAIGRPEDRYGRWELEHGLTVADDGILDAESTRLELILRAERRVAAGLFVHGDLRFHNANVDVPAGPAGTADRFDTHGDFWAPYGGLRYLPNPRVEVVLAYGVDPLDFDIDYAGRRTGRERFRTRRGFDLSPADPFGLERALADARVIGLRAQFVF